MAKPVFIPRSYGVNSSALSISLVITTEIFQIVLMNLSNELGIIKDLKTLGFAF